MNSKCEITVSPGVSGFLSQGSSSNLGVQMAKIFNHMDESIIKSNSKISHYWLVTEKREQLTLWPLLSNYQSSWFCCFQFISGSFSHFLSFLSITFQPLHSSSLWLVYCFECPEGCVFAWGPKSSFLLELGPCLWGWGAGGGDAQVYAASHKCWILTGMGRSRVHTTNEVTAPQPFSWHSDSPALILIQPSAFSTGCHCWPA